MSLEGFAAAKYKLRGKLSELDVILLSAYGIAVKNGFEGTEEEWIASLKGEKGDTGNGLEIADVYNTLAELKASFPYGNDFAYQVTSENGEIFVWSEKANDWVSIGELRGADGKSAYASAKDGGYTGTEAQFNTDLAQVSNKETKGAVTTHNTDTTAHADIREAIANKKSATPVSVTLSTTWTEQSDGSFAQSVTVSGVTTDSSVVADCALSGTDIDADIETLNAWGCVNRAEQGSGTLTFYCYGDTPTVAIPLNVVVM